MAATNYEIVKRGKSEVQSFYSTRYIHNFYPTQQVSAPVGKRGI